MTPPKIAGKDFASNINASDKFNIKTLKQIGEGTDRKVFDLGEGKVLKVAKNPRGVDQNLNALNKKLQDSGVIPKVHEVGKDYVVMEKLKTPSQLSITEKKIVNDLVGDVEGLLKREANVDEIRKVLGKYGWQDIADLDIKTFGWGDIKPKNISIKGGKPVLIDEGTINLIKVLKKYKRKVALAPVKVGAIAGLVSGLDGDTIYDIFGTLFGGDVLKKNSPQVNERIFAPRG